MSERDPTEGIPEIVANFLRSMPNPEKKNVLWGEGSDSTNELADEVVRRTDVGKELCISYLQTELETLAKDPSWDLDPNLVDNLVSRIRDNGSLDAEGIPLGTGVYSGSEVILELRAESLHGKEFYASHLRKVIETFQEQLN